MVKPNYRYFRMRVKPVIVKNENELPPGTWVTIPQASKQTGLSQDVIRWRFFRREIRGYKIRYLALSKHSPLLVNLEEL